LADQRRQTLALGAGRSPVCILRSGQHARRRSAGVLAGGGLPRNTLQRPVGGLSDLPFRPHAVMLGTS